MPITNSKNLMIDSIEGSSERGGWQASGTFINDQENAVFGRRTDIFIKSEGNGVWDVEDHLALRGCIIPQNLSFTKRQSQIPVVIPTSDYFLENAGLQGIYFTNVTPSTNPHQIPNLNLGKIVEHIIEDHTNISLETPGGWVDTSGINTWSSTSVDVYTVRQTNSIWSAIENIASNEFFVRYFTKHDELIYDFHPQFRSSLPSPTLTLNASNLVGVPEISFRNELKLDQAQLYALTDQGVILRSDYPTNVGTEGRRQKFANIRCNSQSRLDLLAQRVFKFTNREINVRLSIAGAWGTYLELYDRVAVTYSGTDRNGVTVEWVNKKFWVAGVRVSKVSHFAYLTELELEEENL